MRRFPAVVLLIGSGLMQAGAQGAHDGSVVTGHVTCTDTNAPARLAKISLNPLRDSSSKDMAAAPGAETDLNGDFRFENVRPGRYLVLAELPGYISGISSLDAKQRAHLNEASVTIPGGSVLDVTRGVPATVDLSLERGAAVSGDIRYDDGTPAIGIRVAVERKNGDGHWEGVLGSSAETAPIIFGGGNGAQPTDSRGHFRLDGLPTGDYLVHGQLAAQTVTMPVTGTGEVGIFEHPGESLDLFNGDVFWRRDAKPIHLDAGEDTEVDLTIPIGKLLDVTGTVTTAGDGHGVNLGSVTMQLRDDPEETRSTEIEEGGRFHFFHVPAGDYVFRTTDAADGPPHEPNAEAPKPTQRYGRAEQAVSIAAGSTQVNLTVPDMTDGASNGENTNPH